MDRFLFSNNLDSIIDVIVRSNFTYFGLKILNDKLFIVYLMSLIYIHPVTLVQRDNRFSLKEENEMKGFIL